MRFNQKGAIPFLLLVAGFGLIAVILFSNTLPFKDSLLSSIFPKSKSYAEELSPLFSGVVSYWDLNEASGQTVQDISGNNNTGLLGAKSTIETTDPTRIAGFLGSGALQFNDATSQRVTGGKNALITNLAQGDFSVSYWQKRDPSSNGNSDTVMGKGGGGGWMVDTNPYRQITFRVTCANGRGAFATPDNSLPYNAMAHVAISWNAATATPDIYINGVRQVLVQNNPCVGGVLSDATAPFSLSAAGNAFKGTLDEVGLWNRALSAEEAWQLYNNGTGLPYGATPSASPRVEPVLSNSPIPLMDMTSEQNYQGFSGGLYENGNTVPTDHHAAGMAKLSEIQPLNQEGSPSAQGKIVLMSIGMSNNSQEFCMGYLTSSGQNCVPDSFMGQAAVDNRVNHTSLVIVNGAKGSQTAPMWDSPTDTNYDRIRDVELPFYGLSEKQVQIIWLKVVTAGVGESPSLPDPTSPAYSLKNKLGLILRAIKVRYPNVKQVFLSSRTYGGYATNNLHPEPHAYETGFANKWIIQNQIDQMRNNGLPMDIRAGDLNYETGVAPWISWGPYFWAKGTTPRSDGLIWEPNDFKVDRNDGVHLTLKGVHKVGEMLLNFFLTSPYTTWFKAEVTPTPTPSPTPEPSPEPSIEPSPVE